MIDPAPISFEIEIDREPLVRYLRAQYRTSWFYFMLFLGIIVGCVLATKSYEKHSLLPWSTILVAAGWRFFTSLAAFQLLGVAGYIYSARAIPGFVDSLLLSVEGPFLRVRRRIVGVDQDRRIHFRLLHDYSTKQDARMKKYGISTLVITTSMGTEATRSIEVPAVKDCRRVRDMLSEIDSRRENTSAS